MKLSRCFLVMYFLILISCSAKRQSGGQLVTYEEYLKQLSDIKKDYSRKGLKEKKELLFKIISEEMPDYWIGTKWDFNGTTRTPGDGEIACGYFVTTVLFDAGFEIERVKLAQQVSSVMIEKLTVNIKRTGNIETLKEYISGQPDHSVFIIGLDFHTGFITRDGSNFYFIHSNYIRKKGVQKELIDFSSALKASKSFMIGNLSENEKLVESWCK